MRLDALVSSMRSRLRPLCADWPEADFEGMLLDLARITLKYEGRTTSGMYDRRATDRMVAELKEALSNSALHRERTPDHGHGLIREMQEFIERSHRPGAREESER